MNTATVTKSSHFPCAARAFYNKLSPLTTRILFFEAAFHQVLSKSKLFSLNLYIFIIPRLHQLPVIVIRHTLFFELWPETDLGMTWGGSSTPFAIWAASLSSGPWQRYPDGMRWLTENCKNKHQFQFWENTTVCLKILCREEIIDKPKKTLSIEECMGFYPRPKFGFWSWLWK